MDESLQALHPKRNTADSTPSPSNKELYLHILRAQSSGLLPRDMWQSMEGSAAVWHESKYCFETPPAKRSLPHSCQMRPWAADFCVPTTAPIASASSPESAHCAADMAQPGP